MMCVTGQAGCIPPLSGRMLELQARRISRLTCSRLPSWGANPQHQEHCRRPAPFAVDVWITLTEDPG